MNESVGLPVIAGLVIGLAFVVTLGLFLSPSTSATGTYSELKVMMKRSTGDCNCPGYMVSVDETGWVMFEGYDYLAQPGKCQYPINTEKVKELVKEIEKVDFFNLNPEYGEYSDGTASTIIVITMDGRTKAIYNFEGDNAVVIDGFEKKIDDILETKRWVQGEQ